MVEFIGRVVLGNEGQGFSPGQGGAFARSEEWRFAPGIERVKTHLRIAGGASVFRMHIDAIGAAVDLRGAQFDQMKQLLIETAGLQVFFKRVHRVQRIWGIFVVSNARFHESTSPFVWTFHRIWMKVRWRWIRNNLSKRVVEKGYWPDTEATVDEGVETGESDAAAWPGAK